MKSILLCIVCFLIFGFTTNEDKKYSVNLSLEKWSFYANGIEAVKQQLRQSDIQSKIVSYLADSILTPLQSDIVGQIQTQLKDTTKHK